MIGSGRRVGGIFVGVALIAGCLRTIPERRLGAVDAGDAAAAVPVILSIIPNRSPTDGGTTVYVTGSWSEPPVAVLLGSSAHAFTVGDPRHTLSFITLPRARGFVDAVVTFDGGSSATAPAAFEFFDIPFLSGVSPNRGRLDGGTLVTLSGAGLVAAQAWVTFGEAPARIVSIDPGGASMVVESPRGEALDTTGVTVRNQNGETTLAGAFRFVPTIRTVAGAGSLNGRSATNVFLLGARHVAVDGEGRPIVSLSSANQIVRVEPNDTLTTLAGTGASRSDPDGPVATTAIFSPAQLAWNDAGELHFAEQKGHRVRKIADGGLVTVAGTGAPGVSGDNGPATAAAVGTPVGIAFASWGDLLVTQYDDHVVRRVDPNGFIATVAGIRDAGFTVDPAQAVATALRNPAEVVDWSRGSAGFAFADYGNGVVRRVDADGIASIVAGGGDAGFADGLPARDVRLGGPYCLSVAGNGDLLISDRASPRLVRYNADGGDGGTVLSLAGTGSAGSSADGIYAASTGVVAPCGAIAPDGRVLFSEGNRLRAISPNGYLATVAGNSTTNYHGDNGPATLAGLAYPWGLAYSPLTGDLLVADTFNHAVRRIDADGRISTVAGTGVAGYGSDFEATSTARFNYPYGVAADPLGTLFVADSSNHRIRAVYTSLAMVSLVAGTGVATYSGEGASAGVASFNSPVGIKVTPAGDIYFCDSQNHVVRRIRTDGQVDRIAGVPSVATFADGGIGDGSLATSAALSRPLDVAFDSTGNLYVSDTNHHRVRFVRATDGVIKTIAGTGDAAIDPRDEADARTMPFYYPRGICVDSSDRLYVADLSHTVRQLVLVDAGTTWIARRLAGQPGDAGSGGDNGFSDQAELYAPGGVACGEFGGWFVADSFNHRVRRME